MARKKRIPKTSEQRLLECEEHLYFLWDERQLYQTQPARYKNIASQLRVLVGDQKPARRLLPAMMEQYGFAYDVQPPGPPFDKQPINMVGWRDDPIIKALTKEIEAAGDDPQKIETVLEHQAALRRPVPFSEYVEKGLAVYISPYDYSHQDLVLAVAQQIGSGHEDPLVDEPIVQMQSTRIGGQEGHIALLIDFADLVIEVGMMFMGHVIEKHGYEPRYFVGPNGPAVPPRIDHPRGAQEIRVDPPEVSAGTNLEAEGTLSVKLVHPHGDWVTNSNRYDFGTLSYGGVSLRPIKDPDCTLRLRFEKQSGMSAELEHRLKDEGSRAVGLAVTWNVGEVKFWVDGKLVGAVPLG